MLLEVTRCSNNISNVFLEIRIVDSKYWSVSGVEMDVKWKVKRGETTKIAKKKEFRKNIVSDTARRILAVFLITITFGFLSWNTITNTKSCKLMWVEWVRQSTSAICWWWWWNHKVKDILIQVDVQFKIFHESFG